MKNTKVFIAIAACCVLGFIIYFLAGGNYGGENTPQSTDPPKESSEPTAQSPNEPAPAPPENESPAVEQPSDTGETGAKLGEILMAAAEYYNDISGTTQVITKDGLLYNVAAGMVITPEILVQREYLSPAYIVEGARILYVRSEDISEITPTWEEYSDEMKVCVAVPFENGYLVDTKRENQAKITKEDFFNLLLPYNSDHGEIRRITGSTDDYAEINKAIKAHQNRSSDFYIRYGMRDDKYAVIIASPKDGYGAIYQYVLEYENGEWKVRIPNLETVTKSRVVVNNVFKDLNIELMPNYDVGNYMGTMQNNFAGVTETLIKDGYITREEANLQYISATEDYLFAKYTNGQMFVGIYTDNIWVLGEVSSPENAYNRFKEIDKHAPDFVIIWE